MERLKKINKALILLIILLTTSTVLNFNPVYATPEIYVSPPSIIDTTMDVGMRFNVTLWITGYTNVKAWQVQINYNNAIINATHIWIPSKDPQYIFINKLGFKQTLTALNPSVIVSGLNGICNTAAAGDDHYVIPPGQGKPYSVIITPGPDGALDTNPVGDDRVVGNNITSGQNGIAETAANNNPANPPLDDVQVIPVGQGEPNTIAIDSGPDKILNSAPAGDDWVEGQAVASDTLVFQTPANPPSDPDPAKLAIFEFEVKGRGVTVLNINHSQTFILDPNFNKISVTKTNGYFENVPHMSVNPPKIVDPLLVKGTSFNINVTIVNATGVGSFEFKLGYNASILSVISASLGDFFPPVTPIVKINNTAGYVFFNASLTSPPPRNGTGTLATITFHVEGLGASILDLYDTRLIDQARNVLPQAAPRDGSFINIIRDVAIVKVVPSASFIYAGALVTINVTAKNKGNNETETFDVTAFWNDTNLIGKQTVTNLPPNAETTLTFTWNTSGVSDGIYTIKGEATFVPDEFNPTDNVYIDSTVQVVTQYKITFDQTGVGSDFIGTVVVIDGSNYGVSALPVSLSFYIGSTHNFAFQSPLVVPPGAKQYDWNSTSGLSTLQSGSITATGPGNVTGNYVTRVHDVAVTNVVQDRTWVYQGQAANINVTVKNNGGFAETVNVTLYYNMTAGKIVGTQSITLLVGESKTLLFVWNTAGVPYCHNYTLTAVATIPADYTPADNTLDNVYIKVRIMGDINGDGKVDIIPVDIVAQAFGSYPGHPEWNPEADLNRDGKVDIIDLAMVASNFGKTCSS